MDLSSFSEDPAIQQMQAQQVLYDKIKRVRNVCWDKCMQDGVDSYLNSRQESCIEYCVERFVDAVIITTNRFNQKASGGH